MQRTFITAICKLKRRCRKPDLGKKRVLENYFAKEYVPNSKMQDFDEAKKSL